MCKKEQPEDDDYDGARESKCEKRKEIVQTSDTDMKSEQKESE